MWVLELKLVSDYKSWLPYVLALPPGQIISSEGDVRHGANLCDFLRTLYDVSHTQMLPLNYVIGYRTVVAISQHLKYM